MEQQGDEKALRLQTMLHEALKPMTEKLASLEQEIKTLQQGQEEFKKIINQQNN